MSLLVVVLLSNNNFCSSRVHVSQALQELCIIIIIIVIMGFSITLLHGLHGRGVGERLIALESW